MYRPTGEWSTALDCTSVRDGPLRKNIANDWTRPKAPVHQWSRIADIGQRLPFFDGRFQACSLNTY